MLEFDHLSRRFGDVVALDDVTFSVEPGRMLGFVGRNGAGKTTAMRIALGLVEADAGHVHWKGVPPTAEDRRRRFGYMPEERGLYPKMKVNDQLRFVARLSGLNPAEAVAATDRWLEQLGVADRAGSTLDELSLGNQQRVQLAAAVLHEPDVLVLDEPFSGLDPIGVDLLADALRTQVDRGAALVFSSHQLELVERLCDGVAVIDAGRIVADGPIDELRQRRGGGRRFRVEVAGAIDPRWPEGVAGVTVVSTDGPTVVLELGDGIDDQAVLDAARAAGEVRHFSIVVPTLTDLFREVVVPV